MTHSPRSVFLLAVTFLTLSGRAAAGPKLDGRAGEADCVPGTIKNPGFGNGHLAPWYFKNFFAINGNASVQVVNDTGADGTHRSLLLDIYSNPGVDEQGRNGEVDTEVYQYFKGCPNVTYELSFSMKALKVTENRSPPFLSVVLLSPKYYSPPGGFGCYFYKTNVTCFGDEEETFPVGKWVTLKKSMATLDSGGAWRLKVEGTTSSAPRDPVKTELQVLLDQFVLTPIAS